MDKHRTNTNLLDKYTHGQRRRWQKQFGHGFRAEVSNMKVSSRPSAPTFAYMAGVAAARREQHWNSGRTQEAHSITLAFQDALRHGDLATLSKQFERNIRNAARNGSKPVYTDLVSAA